MQLCSQQRVGPEQRQPAQRLSQFEYRCGHRASDPFRSRRVSPSNALFRLIRLTMTIRYLSMAEQCVRFAVAKRLPRGFCGTYCRYLTEFQSHEPEFDYLKSLEIEEKINQVRWCDSCNSQLLLSTNDKTIKLWRVCAVVASLLACHPVCADPTITY